MTKALPSIAPAFHALPGNDGTEAATARRKPLLNPRAIITTVVF